MRKRARVHAIKTANTKAGRYLRGLTRNNASNFYAKKGYGFYYKVEFRSAKKAEYYHRQKIEQDNKRLWIPF